jgi:hypothetical protein
MAPKPTAEVPDIFQSTISEQPYRTISPIREEHRIRGVEVNRL